MTKLLEVVNNKFKFNERLYSIDDNIYCLIDITVKKLQYDNLKIYYDISYKYINSVDNEICKNLNPLLDLKIDDDQPYTGDIIVSNSFTDELIKYLLMPYEELSNYSGYSTPEHYKRQIIKTISLFWD